jgi:Uma2 family endonuclease
VIEVADSSLRKDRIVKPALYARADVSEYWVINVGARWVEVHTNPVGGEYTCIDRHHPGVPLATSIFPDLAVDLEQILPRP